MLPFQFWLLLGECIAAVVIAAITIKLFPNIQGDSDGSGESDIAENNRQEKALKKRMKDFDKWK